MISGQDDALQDQRSRALSALSGESGEGWLGLCLSDSKREWISAVADSAQSSLT